jgi:hypothetical protein
MDCKRCVLKSQCTRNKSNRTITREENEGLMEANFKRVLKLVNLEKLMAAVS